MRQTLVSGGLDGYPQQLAVAYLSKVLLAVQCAYTAVQCVGSGRLDDGGEFEVKCGTESVDKREIAKLT